MSLAIIILVSIALAGILVMGLWHIRRLDEYQSAMQDLEQEQARCRAEMRQHAALRTAVERKLTLLLDWHAELQQEALNLHFRHEALRGRSMLLIMDNSKRQM